MRRTERRLVTVFGMLGLAVVALPVHATTWWVANNGDDGFFPSCGGAPSLPCRSISKAISLASAKDLIRVGPGVYGDLNGSGVFGDFPGEESAEIGSGCECMIKIDKRLSIISSKGARVTSLDGAGLVQSVVHIIAPGGDLTRIGGANSGLTVRNGVAAGIRTDAASQGIAVQFSMAQANGIGFDMAGGLVGGIPVGVLYSIARDNVVGFALTGQSSAVTSSRAVHNATGFDVAGTSHKLSNNAAVQNGTGFNITLGPGATNPLTMFSSNAAISNSTAGIRVLATDAASSNLIFGRNDVYANGDGAANCGLLTDNQDPINTLKLKATGSFWGAAAGPGADPADAVCDVSIGPINVDTSSPAASPRLAIGGPSVR